MQVSCAEKRSDSENSRFFMDNASTTCNVRVKRCSTLMNIGQVSSAEEQKQNTSHDRASESRACSRDIAENPDLLCPLKRSSTSVVKCLDADTSNLLNDFSRSQNNGSMKAPESPGDDTSCISRLDTTNTAIENSHADAGGQNNGSDNSGSVNSILSSAEALSDPPNVPCKTSINSEESANNHVERPKLGSEPCAVDFSKSATVRESSSKGEASVCCEEKGESFVISMPCAEANYISKTTEIKEGKEKQCLPTEQTSNAEYSHSFQHTIISGSELADDEVKVCDICGDVGQVDLLALCNKCNDGAEHIYCMRVKMDKVPAGDWVCEDCEVNQNSVGEEQEKVEKAEKPLKRSYSIIQKRGKSSLSNLKKRLQVDIGASGFGKKLANAVTTPELHSKISSDNSEALPSTKKRTVGTRDESSEAAHPPKMRVFDRSSSSLGAMSKGKVWKIALSGSSKGTFPVAKSRLLKSKSLNIRDMPVKDRRRLEQGSDRKSAVAKDYYIEDGKSRVLYRSKSLMEARTESSAPNISKAKSMSPISPRINSQIKMKQTEDQSSSPQKSVSRFGSSNADDKMNARAGGSPSGPANSHDHDKSEGREQLSNSPKLRRCPPKKSSVDQLEEKDRIINNDKAGSVCKDKKVPGNRSSRRHYVDNIVPSPTGVIPQADFIWKGDFEISRSDGLFDLFPCIQAHKSRHSCDKVDAVVMELPQKILLEEVPRLSLWSAQFNDTQSMEDNIALYFFPETVESHGAYESLLKQIATNDLALKGHGKGVELWIFSSKVLPPESQRWNSLQYLWGVFRSISVSSSDNEPASQSLLQSPGSHAGSSESQPLGRKERTTAGWPKAEELNTKCTLLTDLNALSLPSPTRVDEISEPGPSTSGPKPLFVQAINNQTLSLGEGSDLYKIRELDLNSCGEKYAEDLAVGHVQHLDRKMKGIAIEQPEPCSRNLIQFLEASPAFYPTYVESSSGSYYIENAGSAISRAEKQSIIPADLDLELSLGSMNRSAKRKTSSLNFETTDDEPCPSKRLRRYEDELSLSLSLAPAGTTRYLKEHPFKLY